MCFGVLQRHVSVCVADAEQAAVKRRFIPVHVYGKQTQKYGTVCRQSVSLAAQVFHNYWIFQLSALQQ